MSVAVAVQSQGKVVIAADTKRTFGSGEVTVENFTDLKIRQVNDAYVATTGWGLYNNILEDYLHGQRNARLEDQRSIFTFFRKFWKDLHQRYSFVSDQRPDDESPFGDLDASFLIVSAHGIFSVACDMSVTRFEQYYAIGSGAPYALGALHALYAPDADPVKIAERSTQAAMALDLYCGGKVTSFSVPAHRKSRARKPAKRTRGRARR